VAVGAVTAVGGTDGWWYPTSRTGSKTPWAANAPGVRTSSTRPESPSPDGPLATPSPVGSGEPLLASLDGSGAAAAVSFSVNRVVNTGVKIKLTKN